MPLIRWLSGRAAILSIVVAFVVVAVGGIIYSWFLEQGDCREDRSSTISREAVIIPQPKLDPVPPSAPESDVEITLLRPPPAELQTKRGPTKIAKGQITVPLPRDRPKFWLVRPDETALGYQDSEFVWCPENYIGEKGCSLPLIDMLAGHRSGTSKIPSEEFAIGQYGITHIPTETRFVAYLGGPRFGLFWEGKSYAPASNGKKYNREDVREAMIEYWRRRVDAIDQNPDAQ